jgi:hypothetical protein
MTRKYFNEMPTLRLKFNNGILEKDFFNLQLPHLVEEVRNETNFVAVHCFPPFYIHQPEVLQTELLNYIKSNIQNNDTKVYFDNGYEGHVTSCLVGIHEVINKLSLNPKNCYFITAGLDSTKIYNEYCLENNINEKINLIMLNTWERHIRYNSPMEVLSKHEFIVEPKQKNFLCFNRIFRLQRLALLGLLYNKNLVNNSFYSYFPNVTYTGKVEPNLNLLRPVLSNQTFDIINEEYNKHKHELPLLLNNPDASPTNYIIDSDLDYYKNSYFSLVTETFFFKIINPAFDEFSIFFSEKIFKPIICKHPFVLLCRPHSLKYLHKMGYKTFAPYIDESYDDIENDEQRLLAVVNEVERLCNQTQNEWLDWLIAVQNIVNHNYNTILNKGIFDHKFIEG